MNWWMNNVGAWITQLALENDSQPDLSANQTFTGINQFTQSVIMAQDVTVGDDLTVIGDANIGATLTVGTTSHLIGAITADSTITAQGTVNTTAGSLLAPNGALLIGTTGTILGALTVGQTLTPANAIVHGNLTLDAFVSCTNVLASGTAIVQGGCIVPGTSRYTYNGNAAARQRIKKIANADAQVVGVSYIPSSDGIVHAGANGTASWAINVPNGSTLVRVSVLHNQPGTLTIFNLSRFTATDWSSATPVSAPASTAIGTTNQTDARTGNNVVTDIDGGNYAVANDTETYVLTAALGQTGTQIRGVRVTYAASGVSDGS
jgi:hypothetical protein